MSEKKFETITWANNLLATNMQSGLAFKGRVMVRVYILREGFHPDVGAPFGGKAG